MTRQNCVYCGKEIVTRSREHVIQNALGGLYESMDICCPQCNNYISKYIDAPFTKIFNPIISQIDNFSKTNKTKSLQPCTGHVLYQGNLYSANIKAGKVVACPELSRILRCDATKLPLQIVSYDFNLENSAFQNGVSKIAFNYALAQGIDFNILQHGLNVQKSGNNITNISFNYPILPFYALNPIDNYLELGTDLELYHNITLFSQDSKLWCYIDLFNTFQYYVLLSDNLTNKANIYNNYAQTLQKPDRTEPDINIYSPKDIMIYAQQYNVEPCMDLTEFKKCVKNAVARKSQKQRIVDIINKKIHSMPFEYKMNMMKNSQIAMLFMQSVHLYIDQYNNVNEKNFRILTPDPDCRYVISYPYAINNEIRKNTKNLSLYTHAKFARLNSYLCQNQK